MSTFNEKTVISKFAKAGLVFDQNKSITKGNKRLRIRSNGSTCYLAIDDLADPNRAEYDYFTTYFPATIKAAINAMK